MTDYPDIQPETRHYEGYVMDAENAAEMARLMLQEQMLTQMMGGVLAEQSDLTGVSRVLDIGCGPGGWLLDLVTEYPQMQGVGIDISQLMTEYASSLAQSKGLSNVSFQVMDATQPLAFPDASFDLINGRILTGFLSTHQWSTLLQECYRLSAPGGIVRLTEAEWGFTNSAALEKLMKLDALALYRGGHSFSPQGANIGTTNMLRYLLRQAGYEATEHRAYALEYSAGTPAHESNVQNMLVVCRMLQPFFEQMEVVTHEEFQKLYEQMEQDFQAEDFCGIDYFLTVWGRKNSVHPPKH